MTNNLSPEAATYLALMQAVDLPDGWDVSDLWLLLAGQVSQLMADRRKALSIADLATLAGAGAVLAHMAARHGGNVKPPSTSATPAGVQKASAPDFMGLFAGQADQMPARSADAAGVSRTCRGFGRVHGRARKLPAEQQSVHADAARRRAAVRHV